MKSSCVARSAKPTDPHAKRKKRTTAKPDRPFLIWTTWSRGLSSSSSISKDRYMYMQLSAFGGFASDFRRFTPSSFRAGTALLYSSQGSRFWFHAHYVVQRFFWSSGHPAPLSGSASLCRVLGKRRQDRRDAQHPGAFTLITDNNLGRAPP